MNTAHRRHPKFSPRVGDGVWHLGRRSYDNWGIVRGLYTDTFTARVNGTPEDQAAVVAVDVDVHTAHGVRKQNWPVTVLQKESFLHYLTRRTGMGRWKWPGAAIFFAFTSVVGYTAWHHPIPELGWRIFARSYVPLVWVVAFYYHWRNYTGRTR